MKVNVITYKHELSLNIAESHFLFKVLKNVAYEKELEVFYSLRGCINIYTQIIKIYTKNTEMQEKRTWPNCN